MSYDDDDAYIPPPDDDNAPAQTGYQRKSNVTALAIPGVEAAHVARWAASDQKNTVRLAEFSRPEQAAIITFYGLPTDINPGHVISLGGKPYCETRGLASVLATRQAIKRISETSVEFFHCADRGCVRQVFTGKYKDQEGKIYDSGYGANGKWVKGRYKEMREESPLPTDRMVVVHLHLELRDGTEIDVHGDACPHNTTSTVRNALIRMASTRAMGRAFRLAVGDPGTTAEELADAAVHEETGETTLAGPGPTAKIVDVGASGPAGAQTSTAPAGAQTAVPTGSAERERDPAVVEMFRRLKVWSGNSLGKSLRFVSEVLGRPVEVANIGDLTGAEAQRCIASLDQREADADRLVAAEPEQPATSHGPTPAPVAQPEQPVDDYGDAMNVVSDHVVQWNARLAEFQRLAAEKGLADAVSQIGLARSVLKQPGLSRFQDLLLAELEQLIAWLRAHEASKPAATSQPTAPTQPPTSAAPSPGVNL